jgi:hypothetical protein
MSNNNNNNNNNNSNNAQNQARQRAATAQYSLSATLAEALRRLDLLRGRSQSLRIHVVSCDAVECAAPSATFGPLVRWLGEYVECPGSLHLDLIGPNIPTSYRSSFITPVTDLLLSVHPDTTSTAATASLPSSSRLRTATVQCHATLYHDFIAAARHRWHHKDDDPDGNTTADDPPPPDLIVAFNAGVWGYDDWRPCLECIMARDGTKRIPRSKKLKMTLR